jgi:peptide/nickel transport system permease protein
MTSSAASAAAASAAPRVIRTRGPWELAFARLRRDHAAIGAAVVLLLVLLVAIFAPAIAALTGHGPAQQFLDVGLTEGGIPVGPSATFLCGTDGLGRDVLVRIAYGARVSLLVGLLASGIAVLVGAVIGIVAGWYGGTVDRMLSRLMDVFLALPFLVFALALVAVVGPSLRISILVIAFFSWASVGRIIRAQTLAIRELEYVQAARTLGASHARIMFVEILPNVAASLIVYATLLIPGAIVAEATLSFLGLSVVPPTPSWGNLLADSMSYYKVAWWFVFFPGMALLITTLAWNVLGDGVRDALAPRREEIAPKNEDFATTPATDPAAVPHPAGDRA